MVKRIPIIELLSNALLPYFPDLNKKLKIAGINKRPEEFLDFVGVQAFVLALFFSILAGIVFNTYDVSLLYTIPVFLFMYLIGYYYYLHYPEVLIYKKKKAIEYDIVFAVKHIIIQVSAGVPLFDALVGVSKGYGEVSKEFRNIVERVTLGEPLTYVLRDVAEKTPSPSFKRILIQIANAVVSGADIADSLESVINQISEEQIIKLKEYGQTLNPVIMFYLIVGIILPTLGTAFLIILLSFVGRGLEFKFYYLVLISFLLGLVQFMFLAYIESSKPRYAMLSD